MITIIMYLLSQINRKLVEAIIQKKMLIIYTTGLKTIK